MRIIRRGLLIVVVAVLLLLALENALVFWLMQEQGLRRGMWVAVVEFSVCVALLVILIWKGKLWPRRQRRV